MYNFSVLNTLGTLLTLSLLLVVCFDFNGVRTFFVKKIKNIVEKIKNSSTCSGILNYFERSNVVRTIVVNVDAPPATLVFVILSLMLVPFIITCIPYFIPYNIGIAAPVIVVIIFAAVYLAVLVREVIDVVREVGVILLGLLVDALLARRRPRASPAD